MSSVTSRAILQEITRFYLDSRDFNGIPVRSLAQTVAVDWTAVVDTLIQLISEERVCVLYSDVHSNPHIMGPPPEATQTQIEKLEKLDADDSHSCAYPLRKHLEQVVDPSDYEGRPYVLTLALGTPQLAHEAFDLSVLEFYRNDPRYSYSTDDISGHIYVSDEYFESHDMAESDQILLQSFGFCHDEDLIRAVAVFVRYLADLSPEHQQIWKARQLVGDFKLHPDYFRASILGEWGEGISVFSAFIHELVAINGMAQATGRPRLFHKDFSQGRRPRDFSFLVRPTLKEFNSFVLLLDKMISENISLDFFQNEVALEYEELRSDGKAVVRRKGTLSVLEEWVHDNFVMDDPEPFDRAVSAFREVREKRQRPAHAIDENVFAQEYFHAQRELILKAYNGVRTLRLLFANDPRASAVDIDPLVRDGHVWTY